MFLLISSHILGKHGALSPPPTPPQQQKNKGALRSVATYIYKPILRGYCLSISK